MSRAILHHMATHETAAAHGDDYRADKAYLTKIELLVAITQHNIVFQAQVMGRAREAIINGTFPEYLKTFFAGYYGDEGYPQWIVNALRSVGVGAFIATLLAYSSVNKG